MISICWDMLKLNFPPLFRAFKVHANEDHIGQCISCLRLDFEMGRGIMHLNFEGNAGCAGNCPFEQPRRVMPLGVSPLLARRK